MSFHYKKTVAMTADLCTIEFHNQNTGARFALPLPRAGFYGHHTTAVLDENDAEKLGEAMIRLFYVLEENDKSESWILSDAIAGVIDLLRNAGP